MKTKVEKTITEFPSRKWPPSSLHKFNKLLTKFHQTLYCGLHTSSGKMRKMWIAHNADSTRKLVLSQENALALTKIRQI